MNINRGIAIGSVIFLLIMIAIFTLMFTGLGARWFLAPFRGAVEEREITNRGQFRIQAYEQFYRWQEDVEAIDLKLTAYPRQLDLRQTTECRGLLARRADIIARYNAASKAERTQGQWMATGLPEILLQSNTRVC